jgi:hypothetical protein
MRAALIARQAAILRVDGRPLFSYILDPYVPKQARQSRVKE